MVPCWVCGLKATISFSQTQFKGQASHAAMSSSEASKDIIKKSFETREGVYRISEYIEGQPRQQQAAGYGRPGFSASASDANNPLAPVRISCSHLESGSDSTLDENGDVVEHICFNHGRELHFMPFSMSKQNHSTEAETTKMYKGTIPTCHDVLVPSPASAHMLAASIRSKTEQQAQQQNGAGGQHAQNGGTATQPASLSSNSAEFPSAQSRFFVLVGFGAGQIQLFETSKPQQYVFFNESRATDASRVSSIKWVPHSPSKFLSAHASGHIYLYDTALPCDHQKPQFVQLKTPQISSSAVGLYVNKSKGENPTHLLSLRTGCVNQVAFSQCGYFLALACQDGFLRVFRFGAEPNALELCVQVRSFFGGFTCVAWSPDGRYLATGGEDDLITLVSFTDNRVVCRGRGHRSWITSVGFDGYCDCSAAPVKPTANNYNSSDPPVLYRLASVGQDTLLCLWELTEDVLVTSQQQLIQRHRLRSRSSLLVNGASVFSPSAAAVTVSSAAIPVRQSATESSNILSIATSNSNDLNLLETLNPNQLTVLQRSTSNTPSPSSTVGSASGASLAGALASKLAFWHRDKYKLGGSKKSKKSKAEKRASLTSTASAVDPQQRRGALEQSAHPNAVPASSSSHQVARSSVSDMANAVGQNGCVGSGASTPPAGSSPHLANGCSLLGTSACPRLSEVPVIDPLVLKKVAADPLSGVAFLKECLLTACQAGYLAVWSRPATGAKENSIVTTQPINPVANNSAASSSSHCWNNKSIDKQASGGGLSATAQSQQQQQEVASSFL